MASKFIYGHNCSSSLKHKLKTFNMAFKPFFQCLFWTRYKDIHSLLSQICTITDESAQWLNAKENASQKSQTWAQNLIAQVRP